MPLAPIQTVLATSGMTFWMDVWQNILLTDFCQGWSWAAGVSKRVGLQFANHYHAMVRCYTCCTIWPGKTMVNLSLPRQLIKICSLQAIWPHWTSSSLPSYCKMMSSFELNYANLFFQLPDHIQSFIQKFATSATDPSDGSLSAWTIPWSLEGFTWRRLHSHVLAWCNSGLCGWHKMAGLSLHLYLFCRLSQKVKFYSINLFHKLIYLFRALIATICNKGSCLCPRCLIPKQYLPGLGTTSDIKLHTKQLCSDTIQCWGNFIQAHDFIYNKGYVVNGKNVDNLLKEGSYVPTEVSSCFQYMTSS